MCCILYCLSHPDFALVLISNRDEYLKRPAAPSQWHSFPSPATFSTEGSPSKSIAKHTLSSPVSSSKPSSSQPVLSGLDAHPAGGGTWLGVTRCGRVAAITNFTEAAPPPIPKGRGLEAYRSRGTLVKDWLIKPECQDDANEQIEEYLQQVASHIDEWPGFNLLAGQILVHRDEKLTKAEIGYVSNRSKKSKAVYLGRENGKGAGGLSNSCLQEPWGKVKQGQRFLDDALRDFDEQKSRGLEQGTAEDKLALHLYDILEKKVTVLDRSNFIDSIQIPPTRLAEGQWYATRTATVFLVRRNGFARWWERDIHVLSPQGEPSRGEELHLEPRYFEWQIQAGGA